MYPFECVDSTESGWDEKNQPQESEPKTICEWYASEFILVKILGAYHHPLFIVVVPSMHL